MSRYGVSGGSRFTQLGTARADDGKAMAEQEQDRGSAVTRGSRRLPGPWDFRHNESRGVRLAAAGIITCEGSALRTQFVAVRLRLRGGALLSDDLGLQSVQLLKGLRQVR